MVITIAINVPRNGLAYNCLMINRLSILSLRAAIVIYYTYE